jgi:hypothetical protein
MNVCIIVLLFLFNYIHLILLCIEIIINNYLLIINDSLAPTTPALTQPNL